MICLTVVTAQEIYDQLYEKSYDFPDDVEQCGWLNEFYDKSSSYYGLQHERPDLLENNMLRAISENTEDTLSSQENYGNNPQDNGRRNSWFSETGDMLIMKVMILNPVQNRNTILSWLQPSAVIRFPVRSVLCGISTL